MSKLPANPMSAMTPLTTGDIVSTGFRLYRSNFRTYFVLALRATFWSIVPFLSLMVVGIGVSLFYTGLSSGLNILISIALFVVFLAVSLQALIKSSLNMALIVRLAYEDFTNSTPSAPTTIVEIHNSLKPRGRRILFTFILSFLILFVINFLLSIAGSTIISILSETLQISNSDWLALLLVNLITFSIYTWISARFFLVEAPIVLEENLSSLQSISRSWQLAQGSVFRILLVMSIAFLVTIPLYSIASVPPILGIVALIPSFNEASDATLLARFLPGLATGVLLFLVMNMMVMGFWQSIKAVLYYDLRSRREGFDINLSHRRD